MEAALRPVAARKIQARFLILIVVANVVLIRVFTEQFAVLPQAVFNISEMVFVLAGVFVLSLAALGFWGRVHTGGLGVSLVLYLAVMGFSTVVNWDRIDPRACATYWLTNLEGPLVFLVFVNSNAQEPSFHRAVFRLMYLLGWLQAVWVVATGQVFQVLENPDAVTGTFGENPNQLCFFALFMIALGIARFKEGRRRSGGVLMAVFGAVFVATFWRVAWVLLPGTVWMTGYLLRRRLSPGRILRVVAVVLGCAWGMLYGLYSVSRAGYFDKTPVQGQVHLFEMAVAESFTGLDKVLGFPKVRAFADVPAVWMEQVHFVFLGTGPGTYNSRAYHMFALIEVIGSAVETGVTYDLVKTLEVYRTEISDKYILPVVQNARISAQVGGPYSSYVANFVELGLFGGLCWVWMYVRMFLVCRRVFLHSPDRFYRRVAYATAAFLVFAAQAAVFDDWFAVGRVMVILWVLLGILSSYDGGMRPRSAFDRGLIR